MLIRFEGVGGFEDLGQGGGGGQPGGAIRVRMAMASSVAALRSYAVLAAAGTLGRTAA